MGWEFAAAWVDAPVRAWQWTWRRVSDDGSAVLDESAAFASLDACIGDARRNGFDESGCGPIE